MHLVVPSGQPLFKGGIGGLVAHDSEIVVQAQGMRSYQVLWVVYVLDVNTNLREALFKSFPTAAGEFDPVTVGWSNKAVGEGRAFAALSHGGNSCVGSLDRLVHRTPKKCRL